MISVNQKQMYDQAVKLFNEKTPKDYNKTPSVNNSSKRWGGWLLKDDRNIMIGFVGTRGDVRWHDYEDKANLS